MASVKFENVSKRFPDGTTAVDNLDLSIKDGEFMVFVGPSGCGKTTALRMVAGFEDITSGQLLIDGDIVNDTDCGDRDIAMVFQNYALYPHLTVEQNLDFPLKLARIGKQERNERIARTAKMLGIQSYLGRRPVSLSGGQRQRVAMGRALVREPKVFLMDEPLSNLDTKLRTQMRGEIAQLQRKLGVTTIYVTHDQVEALTMGDRVAVMRDGHLQQVDDPLTLYQSPANLFVAAFIGSPPMNLLEAELEIAGEAAFLHVGQQQIRLTEQERPASDYSRRVVAGFRPEALTPERTPGRILSGVVEMRESIGSDLLIRFGLPGSARLSAQLCAMAQLVEGEPLQNGMQDGSRAILLARMAPTLSHRVADLISVGVVPNAIRLFDAADGTAIPARVPANPLTKR